MNRAQLNRSQELAMRGLVKLRVDLQSQLEEVGVALREHIVLYARELGLPPDDYDCVQEGNALFLVSQEAEESEAPVGDG